MALSSDYTRKLSTQRAKEKLGFSIPDFSKMRIVLLGKNASENSRVGNLILGTVAFNSEAPSDENILHFTQRVGGMLKKRHVTIIINSQLLKPSVSDDQITQTVRECVHLSDPGPHVFILVLQHKDFTEEDLRRVKHVLKEFSEDAIKHTIVLTDVEKKHKAKGASVKVNAFIQQLTAECGGGHIQVKDERKIRSQIFKSVENTLKRKYYSETMNETPKIGLSEDTEDSGSMDSDLSEDENIDESHKEKKKERSTFSLPHIPNPFSRRKRSPDGDRPNMSALNLVVCGNDGTLKSIISDLILQKTDRRSDEELHGCLITLEELPALIGLSEEEVMRQTLRCVSLCHPGVHAFLLVVPVGPLTNEDTAEIEKIQNIFDSREHFVVLFTSDLSVEALATDFVKFNTGSQRLIRDCGGQYKVIGFKEPGNSRQIPELLSYIKNTKTEPYSLQMYVKVQENRVRHELEEQHQKELKRKDNEIKELQKKIQSEGTKEVMDDLKCLRIVLLGRTGSGKSATGNTILGREEFESELRTDSVTTVCEKRVGEVEGRSVAVVDTPGLFDNKVSSDHVVEEIMRCISLSSPGPHVFVIVLSLGRFTKEEMDTVDLIKKIFGHKAAQFSIVLFTGGDNLGNKSIDKYVSESQNAEFKKLLRDCGNRFLLFNNRAKQDKTQVINLINMIEEVKNTNQGQYFTNSMFEEAEISIKKRMEEILKEKEREIQAQKDELQAKYEMEMKNIKKKLEEEKQRADEEKMNMENQIKEKEKKLNKEFEEKEKTEQKKRETENQKRSEEEKQQRAEFHQKIEEMKRKIESQRIQYEKQQKDREEEDRKREEKYIQDQAKIKNEQVRIIAELQMKQEEDIKKRESEQQKKNEEEEKERQKWGRKIKEAEHDRKETQEDIKRQQREWEDEKKQQTREREEEERKIQEKHKKELKEKQEELEKMRERFEREREEERQKIEDERQKQKREREEKEREYEEKKQGTERYYEQLEQKRKEEWERKKGEDVKRREEERKRWERKIEDLKQEQEEEKKRREKDEEKRKVREEKERDEMKQKHDEEIKEMKKKHKDEARKQAEELNDFKEKKEQHVQHLQQMLEDHRKQQELLENLYQHLKTQKGEEIRNLQKQVEELKNKCVIL